MIMILVDQTKRFEGGIIAESNRITSLFFYLRRSTTMLEYRKKLTTLFWGQTVKLVAFCILSIPAYHIKVDHALVEEGDSL